MALGERIKTALDETRMLILGAQVLLGFQFQGVFQERYEALSPHAQALYGGALGLMVLTVGLLIAPSAFHRIAAAGGEEDGRCLATIGRLAAAALLPLAAGLSIDVAIAGERILGNAWSGGAAGIGVALLALAGWYGAGEMMKQRLGAAERRKAGSERDIREATPLHARIDHMLTEARVVLPGAQALLGFQLAVVLTSAFERLPESSRLLHGAALLCVALSVILLIMPAALHRIVWAGEDSTQMLRTGAPLVAAALVPLALGMATDAYVVFDRIAGSPKVGTALAGGVALSLLGLWFAWPIAAQRRRAAMHGGASSSASLNRW